MIDHLRRAFDHLEWANRRALEAGREAGHGEARRLLAHVLAAERVWLERLRTGDSSGVEIWPEHSFEECGARLAENAGDYRGLLDGISGDELRERLTYRNSEGRQFHSPSATCCTTSWSTASTTGARSRSGSVTPATSR